MEESKCGKTLFELIEFNSKLSSSFSIPLTLQLAGKLSLVV